MTIIQELNLDISVDVSGYDRDISWVTSQSGSILDCQNHFCTIFVDRYMHISYMAIDYMTLDYSQYKKSGE